MSIRVLVAAGAAFLLLTGCAGDDQEAIDSTSPVPPSLSTDLLLEPVQMSDWNGFMVWQEADQTPDPLVELCSTPRPGELGALAAADRAYVTTEGGMTGHNRVMAFGSAADAAAANGALQQALTECGGSVISDPGSAMTWTMSEAIGGGSDDATFEFVGVAAIGEYVTVVEFTLAGQDANWESDPILDSLNSSLEALSDAG